MTLSGYRYTAAAGETFDSIAAAVYGSATRAPELLCANPELCRTAVFTGGEQLYLPVVEVAAAADGALPAKAPWKEADA